jgi:hypothetical protein
LFRAGRTKKIIYTHHDNTLLTTGSQGTEKAMAKKTLGSNKSVTAIVTNRPKKSLGRALIQPLSAICVAPLAVN